MKIRVVLVEPEGAVNVGFVARACVNFGVDELVLVNPRADLEEALTYSAKAKDFLNKAIIMNDYDEAIKGFDLVATTSSKGYSRGNHIRQAIDLRTFVENIVGRVNSVAIIFGRESSGLKRSELDKADVLVTIPANPRYPVLNLNQAVAIVLYELWLVLKRTSQNLPPRASRDILDKIIDIINHIAVKTGIQEHKRVRLERTIRNILFRSSPSLFEAKMLEYFLRKVYRSIEEKH